VDPAPTRIVVELNPGAVPITGRIHARAHPSQPFTGWTGLFAALRAAAGEGTESIAGDGDLFPAAENRRRFVK
jgi:hypothetical protein